MFCQDNLPTSSAANCVLLEAFKLKMVKWSEFCRKCSLLFCVLRVEIPPFKANPVWELSWEIGSCSLTVGMYSNSVSLLFCWSWRLIFTSWEGHIDHYWKYLQFFWCKEKSSEKPWVNFEELQVLQPVHNNILTATLWKLPVNKDWFIYIYIDMHLYKSIYLYLSMSYLIFMIGKHSFKGKKEKAGKMADRTR